MRNIENERSENRNKLTRYVETYLYITLLFLFLTINSKNNVLEAIQLIKDFVGESVPIIDEDKNILGIVTESDLFTELLKAEKVREDEELAD